jgi:hypothetical protein
MRISSLRWPVIGLALAVVIAFALSRGLYIGAIIDVSAREGPGNLLYSKSCRYLHFDGVHDTIGNERRSRDEAESASCSLLEGAD